MLWNDVYLIVKEDKWDKGLFYSVRTGNSANSSPVACFSDIESARRSAVAYNRIYCDKHHIYNVLERKIVE